jgi:hypothetical protein
VPVFYYSATFDESVQLLRDLCAQGCRVIPGQTYEQPEAPEFASVTEELVRLLREGPAFYLAGEFSRFPTPLYRLGKGPAEGRYVVDSMTQGPLLDGSLARVNVVDDVPTLLLGNLSYRQWYKHPETGEWEKPTADLKSAYRRAVATMKKCLVTEPDAKFHVGPEALRMVREGRARLREYFPGVNAK